MITKRPKEEIDFVVLIPIEVKAEDKVKSKSLRQFITIDNHERNLKGLRFSMKGIIDQDWMIKVPLKVVNPYLNNNLKIKEVFKRGSMKNNLWHLFRCSLKSK